MTLENDLECLWHVNYYDTPLSGMARYNGEYVWFEAMGEFDELSPYGLYSLSEDDLTLEFERHKRFQEYVGYHTDHHPDIYKPFHMIDENKFKKFYETLEKGSKLNKPENLLVEVDWSQFKYWLRPQC